MSHFNRHVGIQNKVKLALRSVEYFNSNQWEFTNDNIFMLKNELNEKDLKLFNFDLKSLNWQDYTEQYYLGIKKHLLKDDMNGIEKARRRIHRFHLNINIRILKYFKF